MLCEVEGGIIKEKSETIGFDYYTKDNLPILATEKNNEEQIQMCFDAYKAGEKRKRRHIYGIFYEEKTNTIISF